MVELLPPLRSISSCRGLESHPQGCGASAPGTDPEATPAARDEPRGGGHQQTRQESTQGRRMLSTKGGRRWEKVKGNKKTLRCVGFLKFVEENIQGCIKENGATKKVQGDV